MIHRLTAVLFVYVSLTVAYADEPLPVDPQDVHGKFDNGLRYVIRHNANPPGRVALYLHVKTGALNESDAQNGLAHFLEHMAFTGSTHFPPGKLLPLLGGLGMTFGADTNAHTNLWETVYKLTLPDTQPKHIELACKIFSDYASGLSLSDDAIENERKIILEEYRTREGPATRIRKASSRDMFAGTRLATHDIIGDVELIKTFPASQFRDYYDRWYRPGNMTLIVVGDVKADDVLPAATQWLSPVKARTAPTPPQRAGLTPTTRPRAFVYTDLEQVNADVGFSALTPGEPAVATYEAFVRDVSRAIGTAIVNRRFSNLIAGGRAPFRSAAVGMDHFLTEAVEVTGNAGAEPTDWKPALTALIAEADRATEHGFAEAELELVERGMLAAAQQSVIAEATLDTSRVADAMASAIGQDRPMLSARQRLDLLKRAFAEITVAQISRSFNEAFGNRNMNYSVTLPANNPSVTIPTRDDVLAVAEVAWAASTASPATQAAADTLLAAQPTPGRVVSENADKDLGVTTLTFANNVVMHHKFSNYKKDNVLVSVLMPGGQMEESAANRGVSDLANVLFGRPATSRVSSTEMRDQLTGKNVKVGGGIGQDTLGFSVAGTNADLPAGMQMVYALITDARLEPAGVSEWKRGALLALTKAQSDANARLRKAMADTLMGGEPRYQPLTADDVNRITAANAEAWYKRIVGTAAIEVTVVGDIPLDRATAVIAQYVGSLPDRRSGFDALDPLRTIDRKAGPFGASVTVESVTPQALSVAGFINCEDDTLDRRPMTLAAKILTNRMIDRIRMKDQIVYSISASSKPGHGLPGSGTFVAGSTTDPKNADRLADEILAMMTEFASSGPTDAELVDAKKQVLTEVTSAIREPAWWMAQLSESTYRGRKLDDLKALPGAFETYTAREVQSTFAKYMTPDRVLRYVVTPTTRPTEVR